MVEGASEWPARLDLFADQPAGAVRQAPDRTRHARKGAITTVNGHKVIAVNDTTKGGTLHVATTGKPYPIEVQKKGSEGGRIAFDHYNEPVSLSAPANAVDLSQLH